MGAGDGDGLVGHSAILQAVSDLRADLRRVEDSREKTEKRLFELIDEIKDEVSDVRVSMALQAGERAGERNARDAMPAVKAVAHAALTGWQKFGMWAAIIAAVVGILGGVGQALHFVVTFSTAIYQASKTPH